MLSDTCSFAVPSRIKILFACSLAVHRAYASINLSPFSIDRFCAFYLFCVGITAHSDSRAARLLDAEMAGDVKHWGKRRSSAICLHGISKQSWQPEKLIESLLVSPSEGLVRIRLVYWSVHSLDPQRTARCPENELLCQCRSNCLY